MAISVGIGTVLRTVLFGRFNNAVETRNVFYHEVSSIGVGSGPEDSLVGYARGIWDAFKTDLRINTTVAQNYYQLECGNFDLATGLVVNSEIYSIPAGEQPGGNANESLPPFCTWTFKYIRPSATYRHGFKRFAGVAETSQVNGVAIPAAIVSLNALGATLGNTVNPVHPTTGVPGGGLAIPVITRAEQNGMPVRPILVDNPVAVVYDLLGTQNSRKFGSGI